MRVLFQNRKNALTEWGGDTTQMMQTKDALQKLGVEIDVSLDQEPNLARYDLVHVFNIQRADYSAAQVSNARNAGVPIVLSTIYWDMRHILASNEYFEYLPNSEVRLMAKVHDALPRFYINARTYPRRRLIAKSARRMLAEADLLLPNSYSEMEILALLFDMPQVRAKSVIVPNAVRSDEVAEPAAERVADLPSEYVMEAAMYNPIKGQLKLIGAMMENPEIPLVFVGRDLEGLYGHECRKLGDRRGNTFFYSQIPHEQMSAFYQRAKVHALPSLRESPGLSTLEASLHGANCVVSFHGPIQEYFGEDAWVCDPANVDSIRKSVLQAWHSEPNTRLKDRIQKWFTWEKAAETTLVAYERVLKRSTPTTQEKITP